jgi:hypothetical protein
MRSEVARPVLRRCGAAHGRGRCRESDALPADVSSPTVSAWAYTRRDPTAVTIRTRVGVAHVSERRATGPGTRSAVESRCARRMSAFAGVPPRTSERGAKHIPTRNASVAGGGERQTLGGSASRNAGAEPAGTMTSLRCRRRTPTIHCSMRHGRCCTDWGFAATRTSSRSTMPAGRTSARRRSSPSWRDAIPPRRLERSWPPSGATPPGRSRFGTWTGWRRLAEGRSTRDVSQDFGTSFRGSRNAMAAVRAGHSPPSGASIWRSVPGSASSIGTHT